MSGSWCETSAIGPLTLRLTYRFASDFADLFEVRGERRAARGECRAALESDHSVDAPLPGPRQDRAGHADCVLSGAQDADHRESGVRRISEAARDAQDIRAHAASTDAAGGDWSGRFFYRRMRAARHALHESSERAASIDSSNSVYNEIVAPLRLGPVHADHRHAPRTLPVRRHSLVQHAVRAGRDHHRAHDAVARSRPSPKACSGFSRPRRRPPSSRSATPSRERSCTRCAMERWRICARCRSAATTEASTRRPLFVLLLGEYFRRTGDLETVRSLWPNAEAALAWIDRYGDRDGDGFVEYYRQTKDGPRESRLEGFLRCDLSSRRPAGRRADRALRGAGLRIRRQAARRGARRGAGIFSSAPPRSAPRRRRFADDSKRSSGARSCRHTRWHWTARSSRAG